MNNKTENQFHYFATNAFGWGTAETRAKAIEICARQAGKDAIKSNVKMNGGLYCWSCRVMAPEKAQYTISNYMPEFKTVDGSVTEERMVLESILVTRIQNLSGHVIVEDGKESN